MNNSHLLADVAREHHEEMIATAYNFRRAKQPHPPMPRLTRLVHHAEVVPALLRPGHARTTREPAPAKS